jgi:glutaminase
VITQKSGNGGIVALFPKNCGSNMVSQLNKKGNSELGMHALELLTTKTGMSVFSEKL